MSSGERKRISQIVFFNGQNFFEKKTLQGVSPVCFLLKLVDSIDKFVEFIVKMVDPSTRLKFCYD